MCYTRQITDFGKLQSLLILLLFLGAPVVYGQSPHVLPVNIFGDGNPTNGVEDSREQVFGGRHSGLGFSRQHLNSGTVKCDGKVRGTAMVVDASEYSTDLKGVVIVSAAHVIYDLVKKRRFRRCEFNFLALGEIAAYSARIDMKNVRMGGFDPTKATGSLEFGEGDWAFLYIPKPWKSFNPDGVVKLRDFSWWQVESFRQNGGEFRLVAFDSTAGVISVSKNCTVVESSANDLGGGAWKGQLLDDCDSGGGASGGGIVAIQDEKLYLIGIRSGSHWSEQTFPASDYPTGPPDGSVWNRQTNTNFGRAIDDHLLGELAAFVQLLKLKHSSF
jgi:hypothetical protein